MHVNTTIHTTQGPGETPRTSTDVKDYSVGGEEPVKHCLLLKVIILIFYFEFDLTSWLGARSGRAALSQPAQMNLNLRCSHQEAA